MNKKDEVELGAEVEKEAEDKLKLKKESLMTKIINDSAMPPSVSDLVEGTVIGIDKSAIFIDLLHTAQVSFTAESSSRRAISSKKSL